MHVPARLTVDGRLRQTVLTMPAEFTQTAHPLHHSRTTSCTMFLPAAYRSAAQPAERQLSHAHKRLDEAHSHAALHVRGTAHTAHTTAWHHLQRRSDDTTACRGDAARGCCCFPPAPPVLRTRTHPRASSAAPWVPPGPSSSRGCDGCAPAQRLPPTVPSRGRQGPGESLSAAGPGSDAGPGSGPPHPAACHPLLSMHPAAGWATRALRLQRPRQRRRQWGAGGARAQRRRRRQRRGPCGGPQRARQLQWH